MKQLICINCPLGCNLTVDDSDLTDIKVSGNGCVRGKNYAVSEVTCPKRMVTTTVKVSGGLVAVVPVKTAEAVDKKLIFDVLDVLKTVNLTAPVTMGDVVVKNVCDSGVDVVATKTVEAQS